MLSRLLFLSSKYIFKGNQGLFLSSNTRSYTGLIVYSVHRYISPLYFKNSVISLYLSGHPGKNKRLLLDFFTSASSSDFPGKAFNVPLLIRDCMLRNNPHRVRSLRLSFS